MPKRSLVHSTESPPRPSQVQVLQIRNTNGDWQDGQVSWLRFIIPAAFPKHSLQWHTGRTPLTVAGPLRIFNRIPSWVIMTPVPTLFRCHIYLIPKYEFCQSK